VSERREIYDPELIWKGAGELIATVLSAIIFFASTNIDDIFLLMTWFAQSNGSLTQKQIVIGQYLGFITLVLLSLIGAFGALVISKEWIGLLGIFPIYLGVKALWERYKEKDDATENEPEDQPIEKGAKRNFLQRFLHPNIYKVATITFANGGDNIGIYIPYFSNQDIARLVIIIAIFLVLVAVWCFIGYKLVSHPLVAKNLEQYGHIIVPFVLILLGGYILMESGTIHYFVKKAF
jgi:cadmium resistance transport/sequestration family protein